MMNKNLSSTNHSSGDDLDESLGATPAVHEIGTQKELTKHLSKKISGRYDSLRRNILRYVADRVFEEARYELNEHLKSEHRLRIAKDKTDKYIKHCLELVEAIETKANFSQSQSIPRSQKNELFIGIVNHFNELTDFLKRIEKIENDIRISDVKSTTWFMKTVILSVMSVLMIMMVREGMTTLQEPFDILINEYTDLIFRTLGF